MRRSFIAALAGIRLAAKKGGKSVPPSRGAARPAPSSPSAAEPSPAAAAAAAAAPELLADDAVVWSAPDEIELSTQKEVGVLNLPDYDQWKAAQAANAADEASETAERGSARRRRRREGGKDEPADEAAPPVAAPLAAAADAAAADFAERASQRRERRVEAETAAQQSAATAPLDLRAAAQAERERRRELLLMDPSADVFSRPTPLKRGGGMVGDNPFSFSAAQPASEEYDLISSVLGEGSRTAVGNFYLGPYLQSGHLVIVCVALLSAFANDANFPLTSLPAEYRELIKLALAITYVVNAAVAVYAGALAAPARGLPPLFWVGKCFLLGGVALNELTSVPVKSDKAQGRK